ncbi:MAG: membrane protein insertion efficiency factor YidD [Pseudomonadota bacterium]|nr:membrane protein insertion efficiency factor YidD [Pseudomonadota bacterium]
MVQTVVAKNRTAVKTVLFGLIRGYQLLISPVLGQRCRFHPTCSHYATQAIMQHGTSKGLWLSLRRLMKCHPFHPGGIDFPPNLKEEL